MKRLVVACAVPGLLWAGVAVGGDPIIPLCPLVLDEERQELEDAVLENDLARSRTAAFEEIFVLIDGLYENDAIDRMTWLRARHDRDSAQLTLERAELLLARQRALLDQYRLFCDAGKNERQTIADAYARYRQAECDQQAKAIAIAAVDLEFNRQWLASILDLRTGGVATRQDVIRAELDVQLEEKRMADARRRTSACRDALNDVAGKTEPARPDSAAR